MSYRGHGERGQYQGRNSFLENGDVSHQQEFRHSRQPHLRRLVKLLADLPEIIKHAESELDNCYIYEDLRAEIKKLKEENQILRKNVNELEQEKDKIKQDFQNEKSKAEEIYADEKMRLKQRTNDQEKEISKLRDFKDKVQSQEQNFDRKRSTDSEFQQNIETNDDLKRQLNDAREDLSNVKAELEETKTRLSRVMGSKLTDNNPNIADLSDKNRATKIAEKYQELYDNEWTDAFQIVKNILRDEQKVVSTLLEILLQTMDYCQNKAEIQMNGLRDYILMSKDRQLPASTKKQLKETRKELAVESGKAIYQKYLTDLSNSYSKKATISQKIPFFVKKCFELCWFMVVQDPPVVLAPVIRPCDPFDTNHYKAYTKTGANVDYVVWPALLLHKNGPVLTKGVAQGDGETKRSKFSPPKDRNREQNPNFSRSERAKHTKSAPVAEEQTTRTRRPLEYQQETVNTGKNYQNTHKNQNQDRYERRLETTNKTADIPEDFELDIYLKWGEQPARSILGDRYDVCVGYIKSMKYK